MTDGLPVGERKQLAPPVDDSGPLGWARRHLFSSWANGITTVVLIVAIAWILRWFLEWAVFTANFTAASGSECRGHGACWALIREKARLIFFGTFRDQQWRLFFAVIAMLAMLIMTPIAHGKPKRLALIWSIGSFVTFLLMFGQLHIPLSLFLIAPVVGGVGMTIRRASARPAR
jgi:general L-amino acid transport system permease protein